MADVNDILPGGNGELSDEQLMNFLKGKLSADDLEKITKQMEDDAFVKDAIDGLQQFSSDKKLDNYVRTLNQNLQKQLTLKKQRKEKRKLSNTSWVIIVTTIFLLLCILAYVVIMFVANH